MSRSDCKMDWLSFETDILHLSAAYQRLLDGYKNERHDHPDPPSDEFINYVAYTIKSNGDFARDAIMFCGYFFDYLWEGCDEFKKLSETLTRVIGLKLKSGTEMIGYKKAIALTPTSGLFNYAIVKLRMPSDAKRSKAFGKKCRCSKAVVEDIYLSKGNSYKVKEAISHFDATFIYRVGETVSVLDFDECPWKECAKGIHFFDDESDAINYRF